MIKGNSFCFKCTNSNKCTQKCFFHFTAAILNMKDSTIATLYILKILRHSSDELYLKMYGKTHEPNLMNICMRILWFFSIPLWYELLVWKPIEIVFVFVPFPVIKSLLEVDMNTLIEWCGFSKITLNWFILGLIAARIKFQFSITLLFGHLTV